MLYVGKGTRYEAQSLVPDFMLESEPDARVSVRFTVQTEGTEYGWDKATRTVVGPTQELSLHSPDHTFETTGLNPALRQGKWGASRVKRALKEAVLLDNGVQMNIEQKGLEFKADRGVSVDIL